MTHFGFNSLQHDHRHYISGNHVVNVGSTFISLAASMAYFRITRWFLLQRTLGPVVVCIIKILWDGLHALLLFFIIFISFAVGHFSMFKTFHMTPVDHNQTASSMNSYLMEKPYLADEKEVFSALFWRVFSPGLPEYASIKRTTENENGELSLEFSHFMGLAFWATYQSIVVILLINVLIAMMNTTYTIVWEHADLHWNYSKSYFQVQFLDPKAVFPPPFTIFYYFASFMRSVKDADNESGHNQNLDDQEYANLLRKLVKKKRQVDFDSSVKEDFSDLRKDVQNIVNEQMKLMMREMDNKFQKKKPTKVKR